MLASIRPNTLAPYFYSLSCPEHQQRNEPGQHLQFTIEVRPWHYRFCIHGIDYLVRGILMTVVTYTW